MHFVGVGMHMCAYGRPNAMFRKLFQSLIIHWVFKSDLDYARRVACFTGRSQHSPGVYTGSRDLNSGLHASPLTTIPSSQTSLKFLRQGLLLSCSSPGQAGQCLPGNPPVSASTTLEPQLCGITSAFFMCVLRNQTQVLVLVC